MNELAQKCIDTECELEEALGTKNLLEAIFRAMDGDTELEILEYIKRCYDLD